MVHLTLQAIFTKKKKTTHYSYLGSLKDLHDRTGDLGSNAIPGDHSHRVHLRSEGRTSPSHRAHIGLHRRVRPFNAARRISVDPKATQSQRTHTHHYLITLLSEHTRVCEDDLPLLTETRSIAWVGSPPPRLETTAEDTHTKSRAGTGHALEKVGRSIRRHGRTRMKTKINRERRTLDTRPSATERLRDPLKGTSPLGPMGNKHLHKEQKTPNPAPKSLHPTRAEGDAGHGPPPGRFPSRGGRLLKQLLPLTSTHCQP